MGFDMIWPWISWWFFPWDSMGFGQKHMAENRDSTCINWGLIYWYVIDIWIIMDDYGSCIYIYIHIIYIYIVSGVAPLSQTPAPPEALSFSSTASWDSDWMPLDASDWTASSTERPRRYVVHYGWRHTKDNPHRPPLGSPEPRVWRPQAGILGPPVIARLLVSWVLWWLMERIIVIISC